MCCSCLLIRGFSFSHFPHMLPTSSVPVSLTLVSSLLFLLPVCLSVFIRPHIDQFSICRQLLDRTKTQERTFYASRLKYISENILAFSLVEIQKIINKYHSYVFMINTELYHTLPVSLVKLKDWKRGETAVRREQDPPAPL